MENNTVNIKHLLGKEVVALKDGSYYGKVQSVGINIEERKVTGLFIKLKGIFSGKIFIPFAGIQSFGEHGITLREDYEMDNMQKAVEEKEIFGMPVITFDGTLLGNVDSFAFDKMDGKITEYILTEGLVRDTLHGKALLRATCVARIGKDVIIAAKEVDCGDLEQIGNDGEMIDNFAGTFPEPYSIETEAEFEEDIKDSKVDAGKISAEKAWQQTLQQAKLITEELAEKIKSQAEKVGDEAKDFWIEAQNITQNQLEKFNQIKEEWQEKLTLIQQRKQDEFGQHLLDEIKDKTVSSPLYDDEGEPIILPGQVINNVVVKKAMEKGKLHQLFIITATKEVKDQIDKIETR